MVMQQIVKNKEVSEKSKKNVHFLAGSRQRSTRYTMINTEVIKFGNMNVVKYMTQSNAYLFVMICQHFFSLSVALRFITTSKKILRISEGMYVNIIFFNTKFRMLKYLPGAKASKQTNLVINIIQKFAATLKDILPMILIVHSILFYLSIQPRTSDAEQKISLTSRIVRTCMIGVESCRHFKPNIVTRRMRKSMAEKQHKALTLQGSIFSP